MLIGNLKNVATNQDKPRRAKMKRFLAITCAVGLLVGPGVQSAFALDKDVLNKLPPSGLDAVGLPIASVITGVYQIPNNVQELLSDDGNHADDIVQILNLKGLYVYFHDSKNGNGVASLFVNGGLFEDPYQNGNGLICGPDNVAIGFDQIAAYFGNSPNPSPFPGHTHHVMTAPVVKFSQDGQFATLTANFSDNKAGISGTSSTSWGHIGEYVDDFVKVGGRWWFVHLRPLEDQFPVAGVDPCAP
jgi:SnoaL-like domain